MSDLDDLADAADYRRTARAPKARRRRGGRFFAFFAGFLLAGGISGVAYYHAEKDSGPKSIVEVLRKAIAEQRVQELQTPTTPISPLPDPKFKLSEQGRASYPFAWTWIEVLNQDSEPLTVNAIILNGEFPAQPGAWRVDRADLVPKTSEQFRPLPRTLSIGETLYAMESRPGNYAACYNEQVVFVDVYTSRGNFRYRSGRITGEAPPLDVPKMATIEEAIRVDTERRDEEAAEAFRRYQLQQVVPPLPGGSGVMGPVVIPVGGAPPPPAIPPSANPVQVGNGKR